jgi:hypothetical protein
MVEALSRTGIHKGARKRRLLPWVGALTRKDLIWLDVTEGVGRGRYRPLWTEATDKDGIRRKRPLRAAASSA